jgi:FkbM family methyltransferase
VRSTSPSASPATAPVVPDERAVHVLVRRLRWHAHWALLRNRPVVLRRWWDGMSLELPHSGAAATVYYRRFPSAAIARWMAQLLGPGMAVVDVGAHVGVYSVLAARLVGPQGVVHAIEPQRAHAEVVARNGARNALTNLIAHPLALDEADGEVEFAVDQRSMGGFAGASAAGERIAVPARTLRRFAEDERLQRVDLLKLDAAGNELAVLRGADGLLGAGVENIICKLYHPDVIRERFGIDLAPSATVDHLRTHGYWVELPDGQPADRDAVERVFSAGEYTVAALARRGVQTEA